MTNVSMKKMAPLVGRLFRLKQKWCEFESGSIFLLVNVEPLTQKNAASVTERTFAAYPNPFLAYLLCDEKIYKHATLGVATFFSLFETLDV